MRLPEFRLSGLRSPTAQVAAAGVVMAVGAWLVAWWMVGVVLMVTGVGLGADALLRDNNGRKPSESTHEDILDRYRRAR